MFKFFFIMHLLSREMSGCCDSSSVCVRQQTLCPPPPEQTYPYNVPYTGTEIPLRSNWIVSQTDTSSNPAPFTTNPNWPLNTGADTNQIRTNTQAKTVFNNVNLRKQNGTLFGTGMPVFRTQHEKILYIQAQYSQPLGYPGDNNVPKKGINTLFS
jgi:hypothetical protein